MSLSWYCRRCGDEGEGGHEALQEHEATHPAWFTDVVPMPLTPGHLADVKWITQKEREQKFLPPTDSGVDFSRSVDPA